MSKIISVWGSPNSGKTTFATQIALKYLQQKYVVAIVYCDSLCPSLPVLLPKWRKDDLFSIGEILETQTITSDVILRFTVTMNRHKNLLIYGYKDGENQFTYPRLTQHKIRSFVRALSEVADFIIFDCSSNLDDILSNTLIQYSDAVLRLHTPDLKSVGWGSSQLITYGTALYGGDKTVICLNNVENDGYYPSEEVKSYLKTKPIEMPFSRIVKQSFASGQVLEGSFGGIFSKKLMEIISQLEDVVNANISMNNDNNAVEDLSSENDEYGTLD